MNCHYCKKRIWPWQKAFWVDEKDAVIHSHCVENVYVLTLKKK